MNCNCNKNKIEKPKVMHVFGNVLRLAIPLTLRTIELVETEVEGQPTQEAVATDTDFIPSSDYPVYYELSKTGKTLRFDATMRDGNVAYMEDKGKLPIGTYDIAVLCSDDSGNPYRFKQATVIQVVDTTAEAGIVTPIEYEVETWYLDAAIFLALKGEDGVGIDDIVVDTSDEVSGRNTITFKLTDGREVSFTILNGSGSVDEQLDPDSLHPLSNRFLYSKFNQIDDAFKDVFGDVAYDSNSNEIRFYDKGRTKVIATLSAVPFIKDGMVSNVYISNNTLVITFNTDSGKAPIGVPLSTVFNPNNYYNKLQVDQKISDAVSNIQTYMSQLVDETTGKIYYSKTAEVVLENIDGSRVYNDGDLYYQPVIGQIVMFSTRHGGADILLGAPSTKLIYACRADKATYIWSGEEWQEVGGRGGGMQAAYSNGTITLSGSGGSQPTYSNGTITL